MPAAVPIAGHYQGGHWPWLQHCSCANSQFKPGAYMLSEPCLDHANSTTIQHTQSHQSTCQMHTKGHVISRPESSPSPAPTQSLLLLSSWPRSTLTRPPLSLWQFTVFTPSHVLGSTHNLTHPLMLARPACTSPASRGMCCTARATTPCISLPHSSTQGRTALTLWCPHAAQCTPFNPGRSRRGARHAAA